MHGDASFTGALPSPNDIENKKNIFCNRRLKEERKRKFNSNEWKKSTNGKNFYRQKERENVIYKNKHL